MHNVQLLYFDGDYLSLRV